MGQNNHTKNKKGYQESLVPIKEYAFFYEIPPSRVLVATKTGKLKSAKKIGANNFIEMKAFTFLSQYMGIFCIFCRKIFYNVSYIL